MFEKTRFVNSNHYKSSEEEVMQVVDQEASHKGAGGYLGLDQLLGAWSREEGVEVID